MSIGFAWVTLTAFGTGTVVTNLLKGVQYSCRMEYYGIHFPYQWDAHKLTTGLTSLTTGAFVCG
jgi:ribosomal protein L6P/L9E